MYALRYSSGVKDYKQWYNVKNYITSLYVIFNKDVLQMNGAFKETNDSHEYRR